jgi:hypothetical protein
MEMSVWILVNIRQLKTASYALVKNLALAHACDEHGNGSCLHLQHLQHAV